METKTKFKRQGRFIEDLIQYCNWLISKSDRSEFERGYRYGIEHIRDQLNKIVNSRYEIWVQVKNAKKMKEDE